MTDMSLHRSFYRLTLSTLVAVYMLIFVGGIVRSTGSGMGCPDWPTCFGQWVPPTSVAQLPENYKEVYAEYRHAKNIRFAKYLKALGFDSTAEELLSDESIKQEADFNPVKTWIEYVNRLVGVVIGILIFAVFVSSLRYWKSNRSWTALAFFTFILVGFQGWIGSVVVSTNLTPWTITLHMFLALIIVALLIYLVYQSGLTQHTIEFPGGKIWVIGCIGILLIQILLGTQVREALDMAATQLSDRSAWVAALGVPFLIHRSFSWIVFLIHAALLLKLVRSGQPKGFVLTIFLLILGSILTGVGMAYFSVPPFLQPIHLVLATLAFGLLFLLVLRITTNSKSVKA